MLSQTRGRWSQALCTAILICSLLVVLQACSNRGLSIESVDEVRANVDQQRGALHRREAVLVPLEAMTSEQKYLLGLYLVSLGSDERIHHYFVVTGMLFLSGRDYEPENDLDRFIWARWVGGWHKLGYVEASLEEANLLRLYESTYERLNEKARRILAQRHKHGKYSGYRLSIRFPLLHDLASEDPEERGNALEKLQKHADRGRIDEASIRDILQSLVDYFAVEVDQRLKIYGGYCFCQVCKKCDSDEDRDFTVPFLEEYVRGGDGMLASEALEVLGSYGGAYRESAISIGRMRVEEAESELRAIFGPDVDVDTLSLASPRALGLDTFLRASKAWEVRKSVRGALSELGGKENP